MAGYNEDIRQRKNMAMGNGTMSGGNHGCESLESANGGHSHPDANISHAPMSDNERAGPPHVSRGGGKMPSTAHSDHGPHQIPG